MEAFRDAVRNADAVLIATPEYNSSVPGAVKNALDWASRPIATNVFRNKPVAVIGSSAGAFGAVWAQAELRKVLAFRRCFNRLPDVRPVCDLDAKKSTRRSARLCRAARCCVERERG